LNHHAPASTADTEPAHARDSCRRPADDATHPLVTPSRLADQALQDSDARYRALFDTTGSGVAVYDACDGGEDFVIREFNAAAERLERITKSDVVGRKVTEVFPGVRTFGLLDVLTRVWKTGEPERLPISFYNDGRIAGWRENVVSRLPDGAVVAVYEDVTERGQFATALREQLAFLQTLLDAIPSPVFYKDLNGRYLGCNQAFGASLGRTPADIVGKTVFDLSSPELGAFNDAKDAELLRTEQTLVYEAAIQLTDGTLRQVEMHKAVYRNGRRAVAGIVGTWLDIAERKRAEETLRASEERFRRIFEEGPFGMATVGRDSHFIRANAAFREMLGYSQQELVSLTFRDLTHPDHLERDSEAVSALIRGEIAAYRTEKRYIRKDGEAVWGALTLSAIRDRDGRIVHFLAMVRDISKQVLAEEALKESNRELHLRSLITEAFLLAPAEHVYQKVLEIVLSHTGSRHGLFGYLDQDETVIAPALTCASWIPGTTDGATMRFPRGEWEEAPWSRAILEKRTICDHVPGTAPDGRRAMCPLVAIPVLFQDAVIGVIAVADKDGGYSRAEQAALAHIAQHIAPMLHSRLEADGHEAGRRRAEESLTQSLRRLQGAMNGIVQAMVMAVEARDPYTAGHQRRVARLSTAIAEEMGLSPDVVDGVRYASVIHDIGKISVPAEILSKPTRLSAPEIGLVRTHPQSGFDILKDIDFPWPIATIILQHHERLDGSGYPMGLKGNDILLEARILGAADVVDALASHRPYRPALGIDAALSELSTQRNVLYDAAVVDACIRLFAERGFVMGDLD
jgi:PAS domain S-box-containing protein